MTPTDPLTNPPPELLAPAGDWDCLRAAVENGADAVYFGLERFNARLRAQNFTQADLPRVLEFLHTRGVKGYVTFNTLVFSDELADAEDYLRSIISAGTDAVIVQDVGICRLIRALSDDFPIHASTQMTITSRGGVAFARLLGCQQVVLARECSLQEIRKIQTTPSPDLTGPAPLPLEVFVHGALCVAYSGQCLTSEALGGRSANRGECAQACRLPYELIADGVEVPLGDRKYLLSPQDLAGVEVIPDLIAAGVRSFKIEGRLKAPEYVANITRIYRETIDRALKKTGAQPPPAETAARDRYEMEMAFSRGLFTGWLRGINNQQLVHARFAKKHGVHLGEVCAVGSAAVGVKLAAPVRAGDGILLDPREREGREAREQGGRVYGLEQRGGLTWLQFGRGDLDLRAIEPGDQLWKTSDPELERRIRHSFEGEQPRFRRPIWVRVLGRAGEPLRLAVTDEAGRSVEVQSVIRLVTARERPLDRALLDRQLGRLGGTEFYLAGLDLALEGDLLLPVSELNRLRREAITKLRAARAGQPRWHLAAPGQTASTTSPPVESDLSREPPELIVLIRELAQLEAVLQAGVRTVYCEFEDVKKYRVAVTRFHELAAADSETPRARPGSGIFIAPPRIFKMGEEWILEQTASANPDGFLVRNYDHLAFFAGKRCIGDFSLNVANHITARYFREQYRLERLTISYDLNASQVAALLASAPAAWFELTIHQHMPMFHMEHCVFCAFLSSGTDYRNCGRPCDTQTIQLRDRVGAEHPVKADAGCRNTVFNARAQTGAELAGQFLAAGLRKFRIEFLREEPAEIRRTIQQYQKLLAGEVTGANLWRELRLVNRLGVTRGTLQPAPA